MNSKLWIFWGIAVGLLVNHPCYGQSREDEGERLGTTFLNEVCYNAEEGFNWIKKNIHPYLTITEEYDDNVYKNKTDPVGDFITKIYPGVRYVFAPKISSGRVEPLTSITLNCYGEFWHYNTLGKENRRDFKRNVLADLSARGVFFDRLEAYGGVKKEQKFASELLPTEGTTPSERMRDIDYLVTTYGATYRIGAGRYEIPVSYHHHEQTYSSEEDKANNYVRNSFAVDGKVTILPSTKLVASGSFGIVARPKRKNGDSVFKRVALGLEGELSPKVDGELFVGFSSWEHEEGRDSSSMTYDVVINYFLAPYAVLSVSGSHRIQDTVVGAELDAMRDEPLIGGPLTGAPEGERDISSDYAIVTEASVSITYRPPIDSKLVITASAIYNIYEYDTGREDHNRHIYTTLTYLLTEGVTIRAGHRWTERTSDSESVGYKNNIFSLTLLLEF